VDQIGKSINSKHLSLFPAGMNVNFARSVSNNGSSILEYRCFERGINRETLACGTGAVAVSYISRRLNLSHSQKNVVLPYRCRLHQADAQIHVEEDDSGCRLHGYPVMLFEGEFEFNES
jgi:diaminopimelate epimerase